MKQLAPVLVINNLIMFLVDNFYYRCLRPVWQYLVHGVNHTSHVSSSIHRKSMDTIVINPSMTLRYCNLKDISGDGSAGQQSDLNNNQKGGRLVVFFAWMLAKDQHIEKYRNLYFKRGFDILTVKTSPWELIWPTSGSQVIAKNVMNFLVDKRDDYPEVLIHAFSVGGYQLGEMLVHIERNQQIVTDLTKRLKGVICDSGVDMDGIPYGLSRVVTKNPILRPLFRVMIATYMKLFYSVATKHYAASSDAYKNNITRCPSLIICSLKDFVGTSGANRKVMDRWLQNKQDVQWKCFDKSSHVGHYHKYPEEYNHEIDLFLKKINL